MSSDKCGNDMGMLAKMGKKEKLEVIETAMKKNEREKRMVVVE